MKHDKSLSLAAKPTLNSTATEEAHRRLRETSPETYAALMRAKEAGLTMSVKPPLKYRVVGYSDTGYGTRFQVGVEEKTK